MTAQPFVKWVGGKRQSLKLLLPRVPEHIREKGVYFEPFVGGGALFFALAPKRAVLADSNERLIRTYRAIRDNVERVIELLTLYQTNHTKLGKKLFMAQRALDVDQFFADKKHDPELAAWFIYMNRTCFNGVYRVNQSGRFNVPFGSHKNPTICDADNLRECSAVLKGAELHVADFRDLEGHPDCRPDRAFVYFDPPYAPLSATSDFTSYTKEKFTVHDQLALRDTVYRLKSKGVPVLLSNSAAPLIRDLYARYFQITEISARRAVNAHTAKRGPVKELLIQ